MGNNTDRSTFSLEIDSENTPIALKKLLNIVALSNGLERAYIELEFDGPVALKPEREGTVIEEIEEPEPEVEEPEEPPSSSEELIEGVRESKVPSVGKGTEAYYVLWALSQRDKMLHTPEIREIMKQEFDIGKDASISKVLWSLADRGMVDKQQSDRDGRMKKYSLTSKGKAALSMSEQKG